jgi:succinate dehydrogenase / fumarate reductase membrane anchor subunit
MKKLMIIAILVFLFWGIMIFWGNGFGIVAV